MKLKTAASEVKQIVCPVEFKSMDDATGSFDGYASIFGNVDLGGDVIERGAFKEMVKNEDGNVVLLWQHDARQPLGVAEVTQDDKGLKFKGKLVLEDPVARKAYAHMKAKSVRGMSIGYDVLKDGSELLQSGVRLLKSLKLWEISLVTFGMNPVAGVAGVKDKVQAQITNIREFEKHLRDVGFSEAAAKILCRSWKDLPDQRDVGRGADDAEEKALIERIIGKCNF